VRLLTEGRAGEVIDLDDEAGDPQGPSIALVLNPANQGQMPAIDLSMFDTVSCDGSRSPSETPA
jgi:hypothetical protein